MIDKLHLLYAVYGMAVMFHSMMAWLFIYRRQSRLRILLCSLMALMGVNYFKDLFFLSNPDNVEGAFSVYSPFIASIDITALPLFVLVLIELCFPRFLTFFKGTVIIAPFALCVALFLCTLSSRIYFLLYALSVVYGILAIILVLWRLPVYRRLIQQKEYSNINKVHFHWTYYILSCFIAMLITWMIRTATKNMYADMLYIFISIFGWALVANCLVQIETVVKSVIMNGFDDIDAYHTFLADKAKVTLSPSLSGFSQIKTTDDGKADDQEPSETIINVDNNMGQDNAEVSSPANIADDEDCESSDSDEVDSKGLTAADRTMFAEMSDRLSAIFKEEKIYLDPELSLSTLANRLGTNRTYMSMFFNVYCGTTFYDYVNKYRLDYSKHLLTDSDYTYEVIATMSGFNSLSTFRRAFQQMCGCSPKQWRMGEKFPPPDGKIINFGW